MLVFYYILFEFYFRNLCNKRFWSSFSLLLGSCLVLIQHNCRESSSSTSGDWCWLNANDYSFAGKGRLPNTEGIYFDYSNFHFVFAVHKFSLMICNLGSSMGSFKRNNQWTCRTSGIHGFTGCYTTVLCPAFYTWLTNCAGRPWWPQQYSQDGWTSLRVNLYNDWRVRRWLLIFTWGNRTKQHILMILLSQITGSE